MFSERQKYLESFLAQADTVYRYPFYVDGHSVCIDYRITYLSKANPIPVILLTGWGSGWEGIIPLAFSLICEGYRVILLSLPGYGSSENPSRLFFTEGNLYRRYAWLVLNLIRRHEYQKAYFIGHSMGAEILAEAVAIDPTACRKLVLLNPSGVKPVAGFWQKAALMWRFAASGARLRKEYYASPESKDDYLKPLIDMCGQQKSPWGWGRMRQRMVEFNEVCKWRLPEILKGVKRPVVFISGDRDTVYPAYESDRIIQEVVETPNYEYVIVEGLHHNPTLFHSEKTAHIIAEYLS